MTLSHRDMGMRDRGEKKNEMATLLQMQCNANYTLT